MGKAGFLVSFILCISGVHAVDHVVGDKNGWLDILVDYTQWAAGKKFVVGDKLIFNYDSTHDVAVVDKASYGACVASGSTPPYTGGKTTITLTSPGLKYFICTISDHCSAGGMQLTITVEAGSPGGSTPTTPPSPPAPSSSSTPPSDSVPSSPIPPSGTVPTPPPLQSPPNNGGVAGGFGSMNLILIGFSLISATLFAFMG